MTEGEFIALLNSLESYLRRMAIAITGNPQDAEDALQEAVLAAFVARDQLRDVRLFKPWIKKIVAHQCGRQVRKRGKVIPMGRPDEFILNSTYSDEPEMIWELVERLPLLYSRVLILRYAADLKQAEIAKILDLPVGTVKSRLHNALGKLRDIMDEKEGYRYEMPRS